MISFFKRITQFLFHDIWRITEYELSKGKRISYRLVKVTVIAVRGLKDDQLKVRASALTYSIMFALVPLIALFIAVGKGFGFDDIVQNWLEQALIAQKDLIPFIMDFVHKYLETAQGGVFVGIGIVILLYSVMNFFKQFEDAFNSIWQVQKSRSYLRQFTTYFSALFLVPVFIIFSSGISIFIQNITTKNEFFTIFSPFVQFLVKMTPYLIIWIVFTLIYLVIPNTRVKFGNAVIAGLIAGTSFQVFQSLYIFIQVYLSRYNLVYGSFAAIPLLLLWLQISCLIVLLGAEISYAAQNLQNYEYEGDSNNISTRYKKFLSLFLTYTIVKRFENNENAINNDELAATYKLPIRLTNQLLTELTEAEIIVEIVDEDLRTKAYIPAIDINQLTVQMMMERLDTQGSELFLSKKHPKIDELWQRHLNFNKKLDELSEGVLVKDLLPTDETNY